MNAAHTPGPWAWNHDEAGQWFLSPGVLIADTDNGTPGGDEIDRANAALIAAAPELLEAARVIIAQMSDTYKARNGKQMSIEADDGEKCWIVHSDDIVTLEAAIAKAVKPASAELVEA